jgi:hypothetical protein
MILYYFELGKMVEDRGQNRYKVREEDPRREGDSSLAYRANRIWVYNTETDTVNYIKNRYTGTMTPIDEKEFFLIKLQAEWI